jgi:hypothetical protein
MHDAGGQLLGRGAGPPIACTYEGSLEPNQKWWSKKHWDLSLSKLHQKWGELMFAIIPVRWATNGQPAANFTRMSRMSLSFPGILK